jgi:hypothetical protein
VYFLWDEFSIGECGYGYTCSAFYQSEVSKENPRDKRQSSWCGSGGVVFLFPIDLSVFQQLNVVAGKKKKELDPGEMRLYLPFSSYHLTKL